MPLGAIITAAVTPFDHVGRVDEDAFAELLHHLVAHGSDGVVVGGTTGEASTLSDAEQARLVAVAVEELGGRATVIAGAGSNDTRHAVQLTERATEAGADAILSVTPYYNRPPRAGLVAHFRAVAAATDRPVVLYNIPQRTGTDLPNDLLAELAQVDGIDAVKQANGASLAPVDGLELYAGNDDLLADVLDLGGPGGILTASHLVGDRMRRMVDEPAERRAIEAELAPLLATLGTMQAAIALKAALGELGLRTGEPRLPLVPATADERERVRDALAAQGLLEPAGR
jgi:4-hydroxy-tetrahydrodipicolinate synthase